MYPFFYYLAARTWDRQKIIKVQRILNKSMLKVIKVVSYSVETIPQKLYNIRIIRDKIGMRAVDT